MQRKPLALFACQVGPILHEQGRELSMQVLPNGKANGRQEMIWIPIAERTVARLELALEPVEERARHIETTVLDKQEAPISCRPQ